MLSALAPSTAARLLLTAAMRAGTLRAAYSPDQERDEFGRWTDGGGSPEDRESIITSSDWHQQWEDSLLMDEKEAIELYAGTTGRYEYINRHLRGVDEGWRASDRMRGEIKSIDAALEKAGNGPEQLLYRGVSSTALVERLEPGTEFIDKGYVSSSLNENHARVFGRYGRYGSDQTAILRIRTSKGAYISGITGPTTIAGEEVNEYEWLLPRNQTYRVQSVTQKGSVRYFDVVVK